MTRFLRSFTLTSLLLVATSHAQQPAPDKGERVASPTTPKLHEPILDPKLVPSSPFDRYFTTDTLGRTITFYVATPDDLAKDAKLPVILYVQGSGSQSVFTRVERNGSTIAAASGGQGIIRKVAGTRAVVAIAEKPGVNFFECPTQPGSAEEGSTEFRAEHTLPRWATAVDAALRATLALPHADPSRVLVVGHSEGGLVACAVAAKNATVTHVATLAGGGPTQLYDLIELARAGTMCGSIPRSADECVERLLTQWNEVLADPDSADKLFLGHPHRRWTTFCATSPAEELKQTKAKVFIGQGTNDTAVYPPTADMLFATLKSRGQPVTYARVAGDHAFMTNDKQHPDGWEAMHRKVVDWFLLQENKITAP